MSKRKTIEEFIKDASIRHKNIYDYSLSKYIDNKTTVTIICPTHGKFDQIPYSHLSGKGCSYCSGQKVCLQNCLATTNSELVKEWHPTKNKLTPFDITSGSKKEIWWKCDKGEDHFWQVSPKTRKKHGCPFCSGMEVSKENCFEILCPDLVKEWDSNLNLPLVPSEVAINSNKKIYWKCKNNSEHVWKSSVSNRVNKKSGCPFCVNKKVCLENCLEYLNPELAKQWHLSLNCGLTPYDVTSSSSRKVWWKCVKSHKWKTTVNDRSRGNGCPECNESKGNRKITVVLDSIGLIYKKEYRIDGCKNNRTLPFDFAIFKNNNLLGLIEYQGEQHYEVVNFGGHCGINSHLRTLTSDKIKFGYCKDNNIPLLIIPYWEFSKIEVLIKDFIENIFFDTFFIKLILMKLIHFIFS